MRVATEPGAGVGRIEAYLGIDPGKYGAVAAINGASELLELHDFPLRDDEPDLTRLGSIMRSLVLKYKIALAAIEKVHTFSHDGRAGAFAFGENRGFWRAFLAAMAIEELLVPARTWQKAITGGGGDKGESIRVAKLLVKGAEPHLTLKKHDGRAEGMLLAEFARRQWKLRQMTTRGKRDIGRSAG